MIHSERDTARPTVVFIIGPTASGKTELVVRLAGIFDMEVVSSDSRQLYRRLDIATAKPDARQQKIVRHHLIDILEPGDYYNVALYQRAATKSIQKIQDAGKLPFVVGGSGLYLRALVYGYRFPAVPPDPCVRFELEQRALDEGVTALHRELAVVDRDAADRIHPHDLRRIIRALEVYRTTGRRFSQVTRTSQPDFSPLLIGIQFDRDVLYQRIDIRVDQQMEAGMVEETGRLMREGVELHRPSFSSLGYREIAAHMRGECSIEEATRRVKFAVHRYARQQLTWFRRWKGKVTWLAGDDSELLAKVTSLIERSLVSSKTYS